MRSDLKYRYPQVAAVMDQLRSHPFYGDDYIHKKEKVSLDEILDFIYNAGYEITYSLSIRKREMTLWDVIIVDCVFAIEKYSESLRGNLIRLANLFLVKSSFLGEERSALKEWLEKLSRVKEDFNRDHYFYNQPYCLKHIIDPEITHFWDLDFFQKNSIVMNYDKAQLILYVPGFFLEGKSNSQITIENLKSYGEYGRFEVNKTLQYV